ncbi:uncharacterized protein LOC130629064 [Hydractinia symbiolongicarpus]|uniref:uncharacterized protein LOC130629064 n=1 Tax=Hydractinia symbiolongicarpus TaxID=13093 RepID=UPI00254B7F30|nr:uncharacterized protein LOC130629064 [Hydractinia symbiolongicarpus]
MSRWLCFACLIICMVMEVNSKGLNMVIQNNQEDCVFLPKGKNELIVITAQILSSKRNFDLTVLNPDGTQVIAKKEISKCNVEERVPTAGNYGFCFRNNYRSSIVVGFEYDNFKDTSEAKFNKKLKSEKRQFFMSVSKKYENLVQNENDTVISLEELLLEQMRETREENEITGGRYEQVKVGSAFNRSFSDNQKI